MHQCVLRNIAVYLLCIVSTSFCWKYFESLSDLAIENPVMTLDEEPVVNEYFYGNCKDTSKVLYAIIEVHEKAIRDKLIVRGWLDVPRKPTCIVIRAKSAIPEDMYLPSSYSFHFCVLRITYCHSQKTFQYFYYEWFIPPDYVGGGIHHDLVFYGPPDSSIVLQHEKIQTYESL